MFPLQSFGWSIEMRATEHFLKDGYRQREREDAPANMPDIDDFWTETRIADARRMRYQFEVYQLAAEIAKRHGRPRCLDVGSGPPIKSKHFLAPVCTSVALVDHPSVSTVARREFPEARFIACDLESATANCGGRFGLIICADVLEHLYNPVPCMQMIRRHLGRGGTAVLSTPERDYLRGPSCMASPKPEHVREWTRHEVRRFVEHHGFRVRRQLFFPPVRLSSAEFRVSRLLAPFFRCRRWSACQTIVCSLAE